MSRRLLSLGAGLVLALLPSAVRAEVSVVLDQQGNLKRVVYLTRGSGSGAVIWGQLRGRLPLEVMLNPLGDNLGDLAPTLAISPATGIPHVVWPQNVGNQKRLVYSTWNAEGRAWTAPVAIVRPDLLGSDQVEPKLLISDAGAPFLFFTEAARPARVLFVTMSRGVWTPPVLMSDVSVDSRRPAAMFQGGGLKLTYATPTGSVERLFSSVTLLESATNLMDSPIPPGAIPKPKGPNPPPGSGGPSEDPIKYRR